MKKAENYRSKIIKNSREGEKKSFIKNLMKTRNESGRGLQIESPRYNPGITVVQSFIQEAS